MTVAGADRSDEGAGRSISGRVAEDQGDAERVGHTAKSAPSSDLVPYYDEGGVTIYHGDVLDVLAELEIPVDAVVTDPPYASGSRLEAHKSSSGAMLRAGRFADRPEPERYEVGQGVNKYEWDVIDMTTRFGNVMARFYGDNAERWAHEWAEARNREQG